MATELWSGVEWQKLPMMIHGYPSNRKLLHPLLEAALDCLDNSLLNLCATDLCVLGVFTLQAMAISGLLLEGSLSRAQVPQLLEPQVPEFTDVLKRHLSAAPSSLYDDFGDNRRPEDISLPEISVQILGRLLYQLADLPPPPGPHEAPTGQFAFGRNWKQFVERSRLSMRGLMSSVREVRQLFGIPSLEGLKILDLGCGSGLSSLAFRLLGANVVSADVQEESLEAARRMQSIFSPALNPEGQEDTSQWSFAKLSALDAWSLAAFQPVDVVYTWGVLHHTGDVWQAIHNAQLPLAEDGLLIVAVYAEEFYDQKDNIINMKKFYRNANVNQQEHLDIAIGITWLKPLLHAGKNPFEILRNFSETRGMDFWTDVRDWLGGWPTEFVSTSAMLSFAKRTGLRCINVRRNGGNTEFSFTRPSGVVRWTTGRSCLPLVDFREDLTGNFTRLQQKFYHWPQDASASRRWWFSSLPEPMREHSDGDTDPQKNRLLLVTKSGEPFGYPTSHFARPDSVRDLRLSLYAFWDGLAFVSPGEIGKVPEAPAARGVPWTSEDISGLQVCLLPPAELSSEQEQEIYSRGRQVGLV